MTKTTRLLAATCVAVLVAPQVHATPQLIAIGTLTGSSAGANADLSGLTGNLENGVAANFLGGLGSGIAWAGGNTFIAVPDRGPNATPYNGAVDDTSSYIARFQTISMNLTPSGGTLPFTLTPTLAGTTLLSSPTPLVYGTGTALGLPSGAPAANTAGKFYFTGRSDNFDPSQNSGNPNNARLDPEGVRVANGGRVVYVSDEYGPYVYAFDRGTGQRIRSYSLPANLYISNLSPVGATEIASNTTGRVTNKGMEGLAITPDGKTLIGMMQAPLAQDTAVGTPNTFLRIVTIDVASGATKEFGYKLTAGTGVSEIVALNDHEFLVDERDGKGLGAGNNAAVKQVFKIDLAGATPLTPGMTAAQLAAAAVGKSLFLDIVGVLNGAPNNIAKGQIPSKIEGLAIGDDVVIAGVTTHTLWVANDNDFLPLPGDSGPNQFFVFGFTDGDLGGSALIQQQIPEPAAVGLLGLGLLGLVAVRRAKSSQPR